MIDLIENRKMFRKNNSISDSIPLAPVLQILYIIALFCPEILITLFVRGFNITNFLNQYDLIFTDF